MKTPFLLKELEAYCTYWFSLKYIIAEGLVIRIYFFCLNERSDIIQLEDVSRYVSAWFVILYIKSIKIVYAKSQWSFYI